MQHHYGAELEGWLKGRRKTRPQHLLCSTYTCRCSVPSGYHGFPTRMDQNCEPKLTVPSVLPVRYFVLQWEKWLTPLVWRRREWGYLGSCWLEAGIEQPFSAKGQRVNLLSFGWPHSLCHYKALWAADNLRCEWITVTAPHHWEEGSESYLAWKWQWANSWVKRSGDFSCGWLFRD